jgi:hypothetical protein
MGRGSWRVAALESWGACMPSYIDYGGGHVGEVWTD